MKLVHVALRCFGEALSDYRAGLNAGILKVGYEKASGEENRITAIELGVNPKT